MADKVYIDLIKDILENGNKRSDRTGTGTISLFGKQNEIDISKHLACITVKKVFIDSVVKELIWMLSGSSNSKDLEKMGPKFWNANSSREFLDSRGLHHLPEGYLGPTYGFQWRSSGADYLPNLRKHSDNINGFDQIHNCIKLLIEEPTSRRNILTCWIPNKIQEMALPPCHMTFQLYVEQDSNGDNLLSLKLYQRSADMFLGVPFNMLFYSVLVNIFAKLTKMKPHRLINTYGDAHIYLNHIDQAESILNNETKTYPTFKLHDDIQEKIDSAYESSIDLPDRLTKIMESIQPHHIIINGYESHKYVKAPMAT